MTRRVRRWGYKERVKGVVGSIGLVAVAGLREVVRGSASVVRLNEGAQTGGCRERYKAVKGTTDGKHGRGARRA